MEMRSANSYLKKQLASSPSSPWHFFLPGMNPIVSIHYHPSSVLSLTWLVKHLAPVTSLTANTGHAPGVFFWQFETVIIYRKCIVFNWSYCNYPTRGLSTSLTGAKIAKSANTDYTTPQKPDKAKFPTRSVWRAGGIQPQVALCHDASTRLVSTHQTKQGSRTQQWSPPWKAKSQ